jgi:hypothetical protein
LSIALDGRIIHELPTFHQMNQPPDRPAAAALPAQLSCCVLPPRWLEQQHSKHLPHHFLPPLRQREFAEVARAAMVGPTNRV